MLIDARCLSSTDKVYSLANAILLYRGDGKEPVFASVHDVEVTKGVPRIKAGIPVSKTGLVETLKSLAPEDYAPTELLGSHILAKGNDHLAWYSKPQKRQVWFKCRELGDVNALTDHPGLVFIISKGNWYVFAVKSRSRPTPSTPLYVAPYFNVWDGGHICTGNIDIPKGAVKFNTDAWEEAFFRSYFTHPNVHGKNELTTFRGGPFKLWQSLMKGRAFPTHTLVSAGEKLGQAFERTVKHGRP